MSKSKRAVQVAVAAVCFAPPLLIALGFGFEATGAVTVRAWALHGLLSVWWGRLLVSAAWFGLGWSCYRTLYRRRSAA